MFSTSIEVGGLGFSPFEIGLILGVWGLLNATLQILFMGRVLIRFGERPVFISSMLAIFLASCAFAFESFFARRAGRVDALVWTLLCLQLICNFMLSASYGTCHPSRLYHDKANYFFSIYLDTSCTECYE